MGGAFNLSVDGAGFASLTFDLPGEKVNKLTSAALTELGTVIERLAARSDVRALLISSGKKDSFIAGADIGEIQAFGSESEAAHLMRQGQDVLGAIAGLTFPTLAQIDGACLGGGLELALACTYRVATDNPKAVLGFPEVNLGLIPSWGGTQRLPRIVGPAQSLKMILGGKPVSAKAALAMGLVDAVCAAASLEEQAKDFLKQAPGQRRTPRGPGPLARRQLFSRAREDVMRRTQGNTPAPLAALELIRNAERVSLSDGLAQERDAFSKLATGNVSKNLIRLYFVSTALKKETGVQEAVPPRDIKAAGVLGAGVMGSGIAWLFSRQGHDVRMKDVSPEAVAKGSARAREYYRQLEGLGMIDARESELGMARFHGTTDLAGFDALELVVEAIAEDVELKKTALRELENVVRPDAIIATNTSTIPVTEMASVLKHPERYVGMHFFNPVNRMPLVEIIPGAATSPATIATVFQLAKALGKSPVRVGDGPGFLVNRVLVPYLLEAIRLVEEGASPFAVDKVFTRFGMPMGPIALVDEIGLDVQLHITRIMAVSFPDRFSVPALLEDLVQKEGCLGRKAGRGFYVYGGKEKKLNPATARPAPGTPRSREERVEPKAILQRCLFGMINEAARCLSEGIVGDAEHLDLAVILGLGFPSYTGGPMRYAEGLGLPVIAGTLREYERVYGARFRPAESLAEAQPLRVHSAGAK
jgi:3-hydroxyacyl-CoA dehydrogenase / enoyl-CoA hydratase / 3-hydroxybutyryl-CoA epimerase